MTFLFLRSRKKTLPIIQERMKYFDTITDEAAYPLVVTQLPMYNEKAVATRIIDAVAASDYPRSRHEIQVLDDSNDETIQYVDEAVARHRAAGINISVVRRSDRTGFKAGALQHGLEFTKAEYVAIFDADFVPFPDFLRKSIPFFVDNPEIGLVQGRWTHLNRNASLLTRGQAMGIDGHFMVEQAARTWNHLYMNFNGTAGVFRRKAIETSGGWQHDTLTEDMDLSYRMQIAGWKTSYVPLLEVPAEIPEDINGFKNQQFRWAKGSIQTARKIIPQLIKKRLPFFTLLQAIMHLTHYTVHPFMLLLALLTTPILLMVKVNMPPLVFFPIMVGMALSTSGPSVMYLTAQHYLGNGLKRHLIMIPALMLIGIGLAVNNSKAVIEALMGKESPFHRTPKKGQKRATGYRPIKDFTSVAELLVGLYSLVGFQMFFTYSNVLVAPFLVIYASGFLFVGALSIIHYRRPDIIDRPIPSYR
jgi:cellulose synthase/poly-beta-1,6-N-acetylglucosamine synthase-like glycosyltransferase